MVLGRVVGQGLSQGVGAKAMVAVKSRRRGVTFANMVVLMLKVSLERGALSAQVKLKGVL